MQVAWVISIGAELTWGQTVDTNAAWLAAQLAAAGYRAERHVTVGDDQAAIAAVLREAVDAEVAVAVLSGGLGPTADDLTREALADVAGAPLELDADALAQIQAFFARRGRQMAERNRIQAMCPAGGRMMENSSGTAPGIALDIRQTRIYALPGVPFEMRRMFRERVRPELRGEAVLKQRILQTFGLPESEIGERLDDLMSPGRNPEVGTTAKLGVIGVRLNAYGAADDADRALHETETEVRRRLGDLVFGVDEETLAEAVGRLLVERGETVATAESCTGGLVGTWLTDPPGSSKWYPGGVVAYSNDAKVSLLGVDRAVLEAKGAVCAPVASQLAEGARRVLGATYGIGITGIAGPGGGTAEKPVGLVFIGVAGGERETEAREYRFGDDVPRDVIRRRSALVALHRLRRRLLRTADKK